MRGSITLIFNDLHQRGEGKGHLALIWGAREKHGWGSRGEKNQVASKQSVTITMVVEMVHQYHLVDPGKPNTEKCGSHARNHVL
jgi:hypothetical protein